MLSIDDEPTGSGMPVIVDDVVACIEASDHAGKRFGNDTRQTDKYYAAGILETDAS